MRAGLLGERRLERWPQLVGKSGVGKPPSPTGDRTIRVTDVQQVVRQRSADTRIRDQRAMRHNGAGVKIDQPLSPLGIEGDQPGDRFAKPSRHTCVSKAAGRG